MKGAGFSKARSAISLKAWVTTLGWTTRKPSDVRTKTFLSFDDARQLIDARIAELGLSPELVHAFPHSHAFPNIDEHQAFWRLSFEDRMERFKAR